MKLYHYSSVFYEELLTRRYSNKATIEEIKESEKFAIEANNPFAYVDHISFFFDPAPVKILGSLFGKYHDVWYNGNELYQYVVDTADIDLLAYNIVESPKAVKLLNSTIWIDNDKFLFDYKRKLNKLKKDWKEIGYNKEDLNKQINLYKGKTLYYYLLAKARQDFEKNKFKYAANVPHVMLSPIAGKINYESFSKVKVESQHFSDNSSNKQDKIVTRKMINQSKKPFFVDW